MTDRDLPSIVVPENIVATLTNSVAAVLRLCVAPTHGAGAPLSWIARPDAPELIVALLRSAELPASVIPAAAAALSLPVPPLVTAHIGRELVARFEHETGWHPPLYSWCPEDHPIHDDINAWIRRDCYAQRVVDRLRDDAAAQGVWPAHVVIVDDCIHEGGTSALARPLLLQAFPLGVTPAFASLGVASLDTLLDASFASEPLGRRAWPACQRLLSELLRGYEETDDGCVPIDTIERVRTLGDRVAREASVGQYRSQWEHAYATLAAMYGEAALPTVRPRVQAALADAVARRIGARLTATLASDDV